MMCRSSWLQVNIIPIIAKSDAISKSELAKFKIKITSELVSNGVQIYQFPTDDETVAEINSTMNVRNFHMRVFFILHSWAMMLPVKIHFQMESVANNLLWYEATLKQFSAHILSSFKWWCPSAVQLTGNDTTKRETYIIMLSQQRNGC